MKIEKKEIKSIMNIKIITKINNNNKNNYNYNNNIQINYQTFIFKYVKLIKNCEIKRSLFDFILSSK